MTDYTTVRPMGATGSLLSLRGIVDAILAWNDRRVTRNELYRLTDRELEDIGLTRAEIDTAVERLR
jgi:uncharacterized protein YjiS (DUF1127 family)